MKDNSSIDAADHGYVRVDPDAMRLHAKRLRRDIKSLAENGDLAFHKNMEFDITSARMHIQALQEQLDNMMHNINQHRRDIGETWHNSLRKNNEKK